MEGEMTTYEVVRFYADAGRRTRVIIAECTLEEAQNYCNSPESSSTTCTSKAGKARTHRCGAWFNGYRRT